MLVHKENQKPTRFWMQISNAQKGRGDKPQTLNHVNIILKKCDGLTINNKTITEKPTSTKKSIELKQLTFD